MKHLESLGSFSKFSDILIISTFCLEILTHTRFTKIYNRYDKHPSQGLKMSAFKMPEMRALKCGRNTSWETSSQLPGGCSLYFIPLGGTLPPSHMNLPS